MQSIMHGWRFWSRQFRVQTGNGKVQGAKMDTELLIWMVVGLVIGYVARTLFVRHAEYRRVRKEYEEQKARVEAGLKLAREQMMRGR